MDLEKAFSDLIWVSLTALYLTGLLGCLVYLARHPRDKNGKPWADNPRDAFIFGILIVAWPALWIAMIFDFAPGSRRD